jgi:hypothetical protein
MSARKRGNNKRQPRATGPKDICISIMPDGSASEFTPKARQQRYFITTDENGQHIIGTKERALR